MKKYIEKIIWYKLITLWRTFYLIDVVIFTGTFLISNAVLAFVVYGIWLNLIRVLVMPKELKDE